MSTVDGLKSSGFLRCRWLSFPLIKTPVYTVKIQENTSDRLGNCQGEKRFLQGQGTVKEFYLEPEKSDILKKSLGILK